MLLLPYQATWNISSAQKCAVNWRGLLCFCRPPASLSRCVSVLSKVLLEVFCVIQWCATRGRHFIFWPCEFSNVFNLCWSLTSFWCRGQERVKLSSRLRCPFVTCMGAFLSLIFFEQNQKHEFLKWKSVNCKEQETDSSCIRTYHQIKILEMKTDNSIHLMKSFILFFPSFLSSCVFVLIFRSCLHYKQKVT